MDAEYDRIAYDAEQQLNEIRNRHRRDYGQAEIDGYMPCVNSSTCQKTKSLTTVSTAAQNNSSLELTNQENTDSTLK